MFIIYLTITLVILLMLKAINFTLQYDFFNVIDCLKSIVNFESVKYYVNYSRRERRHIRYNNWINLLILINLCLLIVTEMIQLL